MLSFAVHVLGSPLVTASLIGFIGLLLSLGSLRRVGVWIMAVAGIFAYFASTSLVGEAMLAPLERQYPAFDASQAPGVRDIVVLGSGYEPHDHIPVTSALDADGLVRIVEGVRLARLRSDSRLLVSGGARPGFIPGALGYVRLAVDFGIQQSALVVMDRALTTEDEAQEVAGHLGHSPFILVTSAYHMPRAMQLMRLAGANPVAAPTGQLLNAPSGSEGFGLIAGSRGLRKTEAALREYLGLAAMKMGIERAEGK